MTTATPSITENRAELKYRIRAEQASSLLADVSQHLPQHRFTGKGSNQLPRARSFVTTVYFDTRQRDLYRAVLQSEDNLKVRAREYYDLHPELLELATDARQLVRYTPVLWVELKAKQDGRTWKRRIGIPKPDVHAFFARGEVSTAMRELDSARATREGDLIEELLAVRARFETPLEPSCIVNYRRTAYQNADATLRVTIDQKLACFAPSDGLFTQEQALVRERLGHPSHEEVGYVLEVKATAGVPGWLQETLGNIGAAPCGYSKFVTASEAVYGRESRAELVQNQVP